MRKFYQTNWFGIEFESFAKLDDREIAGNDFYSKFYEKFFEKYASYDEISPDWRKLKSEIADFLLKQIQSYPKVASIGCGTGYVENIVTKHYEGLLYAIEPASSVNRWLIKNEKISFLSGYFPEIAYSEKLGALDLCYCNTIDYTMDDKTLLGFLNQVAKYPLKEFLLISASYEDEYLPTLKQRVSIIKNWFKYRAGLKKKQQFWGYIRTRKDYRDLFKASHFPRFEDGLLENGTYWIKGINP